MRKILAALKNISKTDIVKALKSTNIMIGAEWEFIFDEKYLIPSEGNTSESYKNIRPEVLQKLETITKKSIINYWKDRKSHMPLGGNWKIEIDNSLPSEGAELVCPPLSLQKFLKICSQIFKFISKYGYTTNKCGFHINLSLLDQSSYLDAIKLALFLDEDYIRESFSSRANNKYAESLKKIIKQGTLPLDPHISSNTLQKIIHRASKHLIDLAQKYWGINFKNLPEYLEFRYLGGQDYEKKWFKILEIVGMYCCVLLLAVDPEFKKEEYEKRLRDIIKQMLADREGHIKLALEYLNKIKPILYHYKIKLYTKYLIHNSENNYALIIIVSPMDEELGQKIAKLIKRATNERIRYMKESAEKDKNAFSIKLEL